MFQHSALSSYAPTCVLLRELHASAPLCTSHAPGVMTRSSTWDDEQQLSTVMDPRLRIPFWGPMNACMSLSRGLDFDKYYADLLQIKVSTYARPSVYWYPENRRTPNARSGPFCANPPTLTLRVCCERLAEYCGNNIYIPRGSNLAKNRKIG